MLEVPEPEVAAFIGKSLSVREFTYVGTEATLDERGCPRHAPDVRAQASPSREPFKATARASQPPGHSLT